VYGVVEPALPVAAGAVVVVAVCALTAALVKGSPADKPPRIGSVELRPVPTGGGTDEMGADEIGPGTGAGGCGVNPAPCGAARAVAAAAGAAPSVAAAAGLPVASSSMITASALTATSVASVPLMLQSSQTQAIGKTIERARSQSEPNK
jgi:hypothetical protein